MNSILCQLVLTCVVNLQAATPLDELTYGTVLYEYYQEHYEAGMVQALIAEAQNRTGENPVRFRIASGSFAFANGMYVHAQNTFEDLGAEELNELDRQRLAFHLAREYFRRQDWASLAPQLARINLDHSWRGRPLVHPEVEFMRAEQAIHDGHLGRARGILDAIPEGHSLQTYGLFNLGVAYYQKAVDTGASFDAALGIFELLSNMPAYDAEALDLVQRSRLALARLKTQTSEELLGILPGSGRYRNLALASYANMAMQDQDPYTASRIWQMLKQEQNWTTSSANAYLGLPMSLELLSGNGSVTHALVLQAFRDAEKRFEGRLDTLQRVSHQAGNIEWVNNFLSAFSEPPGGKVEKGQALEKWREEVAYADWLEWLSSESIHGLLSDWSELRQMREFLETIPGNLEALDEAAKEIKRRATVAGVLLQQEEGVAGKRKLLAEQITRMQSRISNLESDQVVFTADWMSSIASVKQATFAHRLSGMHEAASTEPDEQYRLEYYQRIKRLQGLLFFELVEGKPARLHVLKKELKASSREMEKLDEAQARLSQAKGNYDQGLAISFGQFRKRAGILDSQVDTALRNRQELLAREIRSGMQREIQRLEQFLLVARIAIARTTDLLATRSNGAES